MVDKVAVCWDLNNDECHFCLEMLFLGVTLVRKTSSNAGNKMVGVRMAAVDILMILNVNMRNN